MQKDTYSVEVIGFSDNEQTVLGSVFGLSARRTPKFVRHEGMGAMPDIFLVDSDDEHAIRQLGARNSLGDVPVVLIGNTSCGTNWMLLSRPIRWMKLFQAFDASIGVTAAIVAGPSEAAPVAPVVEAVSVAPAPVPAVPVPPPPSGDQGFARPNLMVPPSLVASVGAAAGISGVTSSAAASVTATPALSAMPALAAAPASVGSVTARLRAAIDSATEKVLVVDDNATVREFMRNKLAAFNFHVDYAESGEQAIGLTGQHNYSCVFLDVVMPGIDGYQVCKLIKANRSAKKTTVIMLTSKSSPFDKIRGAMSGCDAYLTKPVDEEKLIETIAKFLHTAS
jgi:twitching motility two-component system response regulator PilG